MSDIIDSAEIVQSSSGVFRRSSDSLFFRRKERMSNPSATNVAEVDLIGLQKGVTEEGASAENKIEVSKIMALQLAVRTLAEVSDMLHDIG